MVYVRIINTRKYWHYVGFAVAYFGHQQVQNLIHKLKQIFIDYLLIVFIGHPCIADQSPDFRARLKEAAGGDMTTIHEFQPVPPAQFLKYFSL